MPIHGKPANHLNFLKISAEYITHGFLQESKYSHRLQEFVEIIMECRRLVCRIDVGVQFLSVRLHKRRLFQFSVRIEVSEAYPVVQSHSGGDEDNGE